MSEANKLVVRRVFEELWNQGKLEVAGELIGENYVYRTAHLTELRGLEGCKRLFAQFRAVFPDIHFSIDDMIAEGDKVAVRWRFTGTHAGRWGVTSPTGRTVTVTGMSLHRLKDGQIVEGLIDQDILGMYEQIGLVTDPATLEANKALVRRLGAEVINKGNFEVMEEVLAADYAYHLPHFPEIRGHEAFRQHLIEVRSAIPDLCWTIEDMIAEGDTVMARSTITGTHQGELMGKAPTGKNIAYSGTFAFRILDGRLAEAWNDWDALGLFQQIGLVAPLGQARAAASAAGASAHLDGPEA